MYRFNFKKVFLLIALLTLTCRVHADKEEIDFKDRIIVGDDLGKTLYIKAIENLSQSKTIPYIGAFKIQEKKSIDLSILLALEKLAQFNKVKIITESRLSQEEIKTSINLDNNLKLKNKNIQLLSDLKNFNNVHCKIIANDKYIFIGTTNFDDAEKFYNKRDFIAVITEPELVSELNEKIHLIENNTILDLKDHDFSLMKYNETKIVFGPIEHRQVISQLINAAKEEIVIYQQSLQDDFIVNELIIKLRENIKVRILMSKYPFGINHINKSLPNLVRLMQNGAEFSLTGDIKLANKLPLHIHAKVLIVDGHNSTGKGMYLGSMNFYEPLFSKENKNLNIGIITLNNNYIVEVYNLFNKDWKTHSPNINKLL